MRDGETQRDTEKQGEEKEESEGEMRRGGKTGVREKETGRKHGEMRQEDKKRKNI